MNSSLLYELNIQKEILSTREEALSYISNLGHAKIPMFEVFEARIPRSPVIKPLEARSARSQ